jgi:hypothetical protein
MCQARVGVTHSTEPDEAFGHEVGIGVKFGSDDGE